ncbi:MAG: SDR family oxidoreductase [Burkholderiaceae bacterium]
MSDKPIAWVTGGGSGIGLATAQGLGHAGYRLILSGRTASRLDAAADQLKALGLDAVALALDVADDGAVEAAGQTIAHSYGNVSVLVASAGTNVPNRFWRDLTAADFARVSAINLNGVASAACAVLPGMRAQGRGAIVVISSWAGWRFSAFTGAAYGATKHGLSPLVESLNEQEGRHGIRATLICPGEVATPILKTRPKPPSDADIAQMLLPKDIADAVLYAVNAPDRVCINELVISPRVNRIYSGADDLVGSQG